MPNTLPKNYTKKDIEVAMVRMSGKFDVWDEKLDNIHTQVKTINGRVTENYKCVQNLETWRDRTLGGLSVLTVLVVPVLIYIITLWL